MNAITCPDVYVPGKNFSLFIAGGISGCSDWQPEMMKRFKDVDIDLINPRRCNFDITNPKMSEEQINWEHKHLELADAILFWFPFETLCPITLFELGKYAASDKPIFVGCHPAYGRAFDVKHQLSLIRGDVTVRDNWEELVADVLEYHDVYWVDLMNKEG